MNESAAAGRGTETVRLRVVMPDRWLDSRMEFPADTPIAEIKAKAVPELLQTPDVDLSDYYVEYFEKEILDESRALADLGVSDGGMLSIREYDIDHPPPFRD